MDNTQHLNEIAENTEDIKQSLSEIKKLLVQPLLSQQSPQMKQGDHHPHHFEGPCCLGAIKMTLAIFHKLLTGKGGQGIPPVSISVNICAQTSKSKLVLVLLQPGETATSMDTVFHWLLERFT